MKIRFKLVMQELFQQPARTILVVLSLVLGIWGLGSAILSYRILGDDLNENFLQTNPAHAIVSGTDLESIDWKSIADIEAFEYRNLANLRIEATPGQWIPLTLFQIDNFSNQKIMKIFPDGSSLESASGAIFIERDAKGISDLGIGSEVRIQSDFGLTTIKVKNFVFDPGQAPATQDHKVYAYLDQQTFYQMSNNLPNSRILLRFSNVNSIKDVKAKIANLLDQIPDAKKSLLRIQIPDFLAHPHQWQLNTLLFVLAAVGFLAFFVSAVLVSQIMSALMMRQVKRIAIMKSIGGKPFAIARIYFAMLLGFGLTSLAIALPLIIKTTYLFSGFVADTLNFNILTTNAPLDTIALIILLGIFLPFIFSLPGIVKGIVWPIRLALYNDNTTDSQQKITSNVLLARNLPVRLKIALRSLLANRKRLLVPVFAFSLGVAIFNTGFNIRSSLSNLLVSSQKTYQGDLGIMLKAKIPADLGKMELSKFPGIADTEFWETNKARVESANIYEGEGLSLVSLPIETKMLDFDILRGTWLDPAVPRGVVVNQQVLEQFNVPRLGEKFSILIEDKKIEVILLGVVEEMDLPKIYFSQSEYQKIFTGDQLSNTIMLKLKNREHKNIIETKKELEKFLIDTNWKISNVVSQTERLKIIYDHLSIILFILLVLASSVLIVSVLGQASAQSIGVMLRTRQIGIMRTLGGSPSQVGFIFRLESLLASFGGTILGLGLSVVMSIYASRFFGTLMLGEGAILQYSFSPQGIIITILAALILGFWASRIPARAAMKLPIRTAIAWE